MKIQLRLKQIMLAASLMLSGALQAWTPSDWSKYVPSMPSMSSISQFFTRSASATVLSQSELDAARTAALNETQNNTASIHDGAGISEDGRDLYADLHTNHLTAQSHIEALGIAEKKVFYQEECNNARQLFEKSIIAGDVKELERIFQINSQDFDIYVINGQGIPKQAINIRRASVEKLKYLLRELDQYCLVHIAQFEPMNAYVFCKHTQAVKIHFVDLANKISNILLRLTADMTIAQIIDPAAGVGLPEDIRNQISEPLTIDLDPVDSQNAINQNTVPTMSVSGLLPSKKVIVPVGSVIGVAGAAAIATRTEVGKSVFVGLTERVFNPAYNAITSVDYAALGNRGLALLKNNSLSIGATAAATVAAGAAYKFWPTREEAKSTVKMVSALEYLEAVKAHISKLAEQDIASLQKGDKAAVESVVVLPSTVDTEDKGIKAWVDESVAYLEIEYAKAKDQKTVAPYRTALAMTQNTLRNLITATKMVAQDAMLNTALRNDEAAEFNQQQ